MPSQIPAAPAGLMPRLALSALVGCAALVTGCKSNDPKLTSTPQTPIAPPISVQPLDQTLTSGQTATFGVVASGSGTVTYQWYKDSTANGGAGNTAITGATSSTYTTPAGAPADSGSTYSVVVTTSYGAVTSRSALFTVVASGSVTPFAGSTGSAGSGDGSGAGASFSAPSGLVADASGNLYIADTANHIIRKITPIGAVTTFAGTAGVVGHNDATGASASFNQPTGLAIDGAGNVYVADSGNGIIRKITPGAVVSTLAGTSGVYGHADGTGAAASFAFPQGIAVDASGNVYVADSFNSTIRKITSGGVVTTLAGAAGSVGSADNATGTSATFDGPQGLAIDSSGNLYVADTRNQLIRKITPAGSVTTLAGTANTQGRTDGTTTYARFWNPAGIALAPSGVLYVSEAGNRSIRRVTTAGAVTTQAGSPALSGTVNGTGSAASFREPIALTVDPSGNVFIADDKDHIIRKLIPGS